MSNETGKGLATIGWLGFMGWLVQLGHIEAEDAIWGGLAVMGLLWAC